MAVTITSDFKIREELLYSMFLNRTLIKSNVFNANSNGAFNIVNQKLSGETPKISQMDETSGLVSRRDVFGNIGDLTDKKIQESQVGGPKIRKTLGPVAVTQDSIDEKGWTENDIAAFISEMFAKQILENALSNIISILGTLIEKSSNKFLQTKAVFGLDDFLEGLEFYDENEEMWVLTVVHSTDYVKALKAAAAANRQNDVATLALSQGRLLAVGRPVLKSSNANLAITDADADTASDQAGKWVFFLPRNCFNVVVSRPPAIVQQVVTGKSQLFLRFQAEYNHVLQPKQHEWVGSDKNPTDAQLKTASNWTDRAKSHAGSIGFGLQVLNTV